jgi:hypothetical protein
MPPSRASPSLVLAAYPLQDRVQTSQMSLCVRLLRKWCRVDSEHRTHLPSALDARVKKIQATIFNASKPTQIAVDDRQSVKRPCLIDW